MLGASGILVMDSECGKKLEGAHGRGRFDWPMPSHMAAVTTAFRYGGPDAY